MADVIRARAFSFDSNTEHDVVFLTGTATPGSRFKVLLDAGGTVSAATPLGDASGTVSLEDYVANYVGFGTNASAYQLVGVTADHTGIRFTVSGGGAAGLLLEVIGDDGIDGGIVVRGGGGDPDLDIDLTTSADDSIGAAFFWAFGFSSFTPDANNTSVPATESTAAAYTGALGAAGAKTVGGTLDTGAYNYGFGVAYLNAPGGALLEAAGALEAQNATIAGAARRYRRHTSTGALAAQAAAIAGGAVSPHLSSGALTAQAAVVAGTARRFRVHTSSGDLVGQAAAIAGAAAVPSPEHHTAGAMQAQPASVAGTAHRYARHVASGNLQAQAASIAGTTRRFRLHQATGALVAAAAAVSGQAAGPGSDVGADAVWAYVLPNGLTAAETLVQAHAWLQELRLIHGLVDGSPLEVSTTSRSAGPIEQTVATDSGTGAVTVTRQ